MIEKPREVKEKLLEQCLDMLRKRIADTEEAMRALQQSASEETKSSAGDKYETGREMIQQEMDKYAHTLTEAGKQIQVLEKLDTSFVSPETHVGSVVKTDQGNFFVAVSMNPFTVEEELYQPVSVHSPIGARLLKLKAGDSFSLNNRQYKVIEVY